ncbi:SNF2 family N-terminal domain-containing protein [Phellopilus nigrolimitatus]|nr:SNF2 family N-terminal domain-containing protein [Phellopilus nigrolimitatus]
MISSPAPSSTEISMFDIDSTRVSSAETSPPPSDEGTAKVVEDGDEYEEKENAEMSEEVRYLEDMDDDERFGRLRFLLEKSNRFAQIVHDQMKLARTGSKRTAASTSKAGRGGAKRRRGGAPPPTKRRKARIESDDEADEQLEEKKEGETEFQQPALVTGGKLKGYQLEGVAWMVSLWDNGISGILADEMGLGKTLQTISFCAVHRERSDAPFLIVCPLSVLHNWMDEFAKFAPKIPVVMYHGTPVDRAELRRTVMRPLDDEDEEAGTDTSSSPRRRKRKEQRKPHVVVTTYEMIVKDRKHLAGHKWGYIVVDEGHRLKNFNCKLVQEIKKFTSAGRMILTGTPLHNNLAELWSLLNFILPDIFSDLSTFQQWFNIPTMQTSFNSGQTAEIVSTLHSILKPFLLRRLKVDVEQSLPPKKEYVLYAPLTGEQKAVYEAVLNGSLRRFLIAGKQEPGLDKENEERRAKEKHRMLTEGRKLRKRGTKRNYDVDGDDDEYFKKLKTGELEEIDGITRRKTDDPALIIGREYHYKNAVKQVNNLHLQNAVMQLRKVCSHPFLFDWPVDPITREQVIDDGLVGASGKMLVLDRLLTELFKRGHKVLLFSQFTTMLDIIEAWADEFKGWKLCRIDGSSSPMERREQMSLFQNGGDDPDAPRLFILSTRAGGLGINLTAADTVIFYDQDWNPQMDMQAQDRAHRIGQTKPVLIFRIVSAHTIENTIMQRANEKRKLEALVIAKGKFKAPGSLIAKGGRDKDSLAEIAASLLKLEGEKIQVVPNTEAGKTNVISDKDLNILLDRSPEVFADRVKGWTSADADVQADSAPDKKDARKAAFAVYEATADEGNDALANMLGEDVE